MNTFKKIAARVLVFAITLGCVDLTWLDLSEPVDIFAASVVSGVTDAYDAYDDLRDSSNWSGNLTSQLGITNTEGSRDTTANADTTNFQWGGATPLSNGIYTFNQRNIAATAQVKSGEYLTNTQYEATTGTPTTEPVFITAGGTQWIVDLQYRYISAPYKRTYTFDAASPNYRYYKLGPVDNSVDRYTAGTQSEVSYRAIATVPYNKRPLDYTSYRNGYANYAYKYFEGGEGTNAAQTKTVSVTGVNGASGGTVTFYEADGWDANGWTDRVAPVNRIVSGNSYSMDTTNYATPDVAQAIMVKQQAYDAIMELKNMWKGQLDNYRVDQGSYDVDSDDLDCGINIPDELSFMFTYGGLARRSTVYSASEGAGYTRATMGDTSYSDVDDIWNPVFTTYLYDWHSYYDHDNMTNGYGSAAVKLQTMRGMGFNQSEVYNSITDQCKPGFSGVGAADKNSLLGAFSLHYSTHPVRGYGSPANYDAALYNSFSFASMAAEDVGSNVTIALSDYNKLYAISAEDTTDGNSDRVMKIYPSMLNDYSMISSIYDLSHAGYTEIAHLYYRAVYNLALNYGCMFYYDEAKELFGGMPGFPMNADANAYNAAVNKNLAAIFGQGIQTNISCITDIPFAIFPYGGDLDGSMEDETSSQCVQVNYITIGRILQPGGNESEYIYKVRLEVSTSAIENYYSKDNIPATKYAIQKHADGGTQDANGNYLPLCNSPNQTIGACSKTGCINWQEVACTVCAANGQCGAAHGWTISGTTYTCNDCGYSQGTAPADAATHSCLACGGDHKVTDKHSVATHNHYKVAGHNINTAARDDNHEDRKYMEDAVITASHKVSKDTGDWVESPRNMSGHTDFSQIFENVQWLDITGYTLWQIDSATSKGLSRLLVKPVDINSINASSYNDSIVTKALDKLGYTAYNVNDSGTVRPNGLDTQDGTTVVTSEVLSGLQNHGRIANSFYPGSLGNYIGPVGEEFMKSEKYTSSDATNRIFAYIYAFRRSDCPRLKIGGFTNDSLFAFKLVGVDSQDNMQFRYYPMSQGGRSHTSFYGFFNQALANTLYFTESDWIGSRIPRRSCQPSVGYGNSVMTQSDFLSLNLSNEKDLTMAGAYYDTWEERGTNYIYSSGKYALMPSGFNELSVLNTTCYWVPARLSVLLARGERALIYGASGTCPITDTTDCWIIHSYSCGINQDRHTNWDGLYMMASSGAHCYGCDCIASPVAGIRTVTEKGDVNPNRGSTNIVLDTTYAIPSDYFWKNTSYVINNSSVIDLHKVLYENRGYYEQFVNDAGQQCSVDEHGNIHIKMNHYIHEGLNTDKLSTTANTNLRDKMPYVGYQSSGIDDKDITLDGSGNSQRGYTCDGSTNFKWQDAYALNTNTGTPGFARLGARTLSDKLTTVGNVDNQQTVPNGASNFTGYYPYLFNLNLNRYLANNLYSTGKVDVNYNVVGKLDSETTAAPNNNSQQYGYADSSPIRVNADFLKSSYRANGSPNDIVVYNPVSTESAHIVALSEFLPDGGNAGTDASGQRQYSGAYLDSFLTYVKRDSRLAYKYSMDNLGSNEQYLSGSGILSEMTQTTTKYHYEMNDVSQIDTSYYTMDDYDVSSMSIDGWNTSDYSTTYEVQESGTYDFMFMRTAENYISASAFFQQGDRLYFSENAHALCLRPATQFTLNWSAFKDAYKTLQSTSENESVKNWPEASMDTGLPLYEGMSINIGTGDWQLKSGSLFKLSLTVSNSGDAGYAGIADALQINPIVGVVVNANTRVTDATANTTTYTWYLEATQDTLLSMIPIKVVKDCFLWAGVTFDTEDVVLLCISQDGEVTPVNNVTSYDFFHSNLSYSDSTATSVSFYNHYIVDARGDATVSGFTTFTEAGFYLGMQNLSTYISLKSDAINNPHKVPNSNWRYYVLGWSTSDGHIISSVNDPVLYDATTQLLLPSGRYYYDNGFVTVGSLIDLANKKRLGVYRSTGGNYGLIDLANDGTYTHVSEYTGYEVTEGHFDVIAFGDSTVLTTDKVMPSSDSAEYRQASIANKAFEVVFYATNDDKLAWDVKYSKNIVHKIGTNEDVYDGDGVGKDWKLVETTIVSFDEDAYNAVFGSTLSLDDEFTIYWDNYGNLSTDPTSRSYASLNTVIGVGWDNLVDSQSDVPTHSDWATIYNQDFWTYNNTVNPGTPVTDTTKWIYNKYAIFNVDMYAFTTGDSFTYDESRGDTQGSYSWDPTTPAYRADGTPNNIVYIPAGQKVYLGYYNDDGSSGDDSGHFVDYGFKSSTSDPNGNPYTYHFWCPLSDGEADMTANVQFVVNAINSVDVDTQGGRSPITKRRVTIDDPRSVAINRKDSDNQDIIDEWDNPVYNTGGITLSNNTNIITNISKATSGLFSVCSPVYAKYNNAVNSTSFSIMGRVGGLTVVDSGDPRYQDTFKIADPNWSYAVSPIVRLIERYSNVEGEYGSQYRYLTDTTDVRGRNQIAISNTTYSTAKSGDTYSGAAWYKSVTNLGNRYLLPMSAGFNVHDELVSTLTTTKLGYELYCSLETIGNFYGSAEQRPRQTSADYVNNNLDYGQTKIQIHPMYVAYDRNSHEFFPVDVYMRKGSSYALINAGSLYPSETVANGDHDAPYYLEDAYDATYTSSIATNTGGVSGGAYVLDQSMLRRMVTDTESSITYDVVKNLAPGDSNIAVKDAIKTSMLDSNDYGTNELGGEGLDYSYIYGNAQMLFLREFNRTFIGGTTLALNEQASGNFARNMQRNAEMYAQRWYFGLGLPASSVFVKHGDDCHEYNILTGDYYIICLIDVYAIGEKWAIHYESELSHEAITIDGHSYSADKWNVYDETMPLAIPVCMYDLNRTSSAGDQDTHGSH